MFDGLCRAHGKNGEAARACNRARIIKQRVALAADLQRENASGLERSVRLAYERHVEAVAPRSIRRVRLARLSAAHIALCIEVRRARQREIVMRFEYVRIFVALARERDRAAAVRDGRKPIADLAHAPLREG